MPFERADTDDNVRAVIVTGAGRAFCAGADVSGGAASFDTSGKPRRRRVRQPEARAAAGFVDAIFNCRKPSIAAINGPAVGVGITMTLPMDVRIAAKGAKIGFIFARRGLVPEAGSAWFLPKLVGLPQALRWCLSGRIFDADEARARRSRQRSRRARGTADPRQGDRARDDRGDLRGLGRADAADAVALRRRACSVRTARRSTSRCRSSAAATPTCARASQAFLEKRPPSFPGKGVRRTCRASIPGGQILIDEIAAGSPAMNANDRRRQQHARPVLQHPADPQTGNDVQGRHRRRAIAQGGRGRRRGAGGRRRLRRCRDRDHLCARRAGALDERARRRRRDGALSRARGPL